MNIHDARFSKDSRQQSDDGKSTKLWAKLCLTILFVMLVTGCHRSPFGADQTPCPGEGAEVLVLDYTLNCLYPNEVPEDGCPSIAPNEYTVNDIYICSERSGAQEPYLRLLLNEVLDIDANSPSLGDEASPEVLDASVEEPVDSSSTPRSPAAPEPTSDDDEDN